MTSLTISLFTPEHHPKSPAEIREEISHIPPGSTLHIVGDPDGGGDPLEHPHFFDIAPLLEDPPSSHLALFTSARTLTRREQCLMLSRIKNLNLLVHPFDISSFRCNNTHTFNALYAASLQGITLCLAYNLRVAAVTPILTENAVHLPDIAIGLHSAGLTNIILQYPPRPPLDKPLSPYTQLQPARYSDIHHHVKAAIDSINPVVNLENIPPCMLGTDFDHASQLLGPLSHLKTKVEACASCAFNPSCAGMFSDYIQHYGSSEIGAIREDGTPLWTPLPASLHPAILAVNDIHEKLSKGTINYAILPSPDELLNLLNELSTPCSFWELAQATGYPAPILYLMLTAMKEKGLVSILRDQILLSAPLPPAPFPPRDFSSERLQSDPLLCQLRVSHEDLVKRVHYLIEKVPTGGALAVLGDDDFFSLTMASTGHFSHIAVFELDTTIAKTIEVIAKREQLPITVVHHDLRHAIPVRFWNRFDAFYTDCPYTPAGFELFASRGVTLLKRDPKKHGFVSFSPEFPIMESVEIPVQEACTRMGLFIEGKSHKAANSIPEHIPTTLATPADIHHALTHPESLNPTDAWYLGTLGRKEQLFHFLTTQLTKPTILGPYTGEIYYETSPLQWYKEHLPTKIA